MTIPSLPVCVANVTDDGHAVYTHPVPLPHLKVGDFIDYFAVHPAWRDQDEIRLTMAGRRWKSLERFGINPPDEVCESRGVLRAGVMVIGRGQLPIKLRGFFRRE